MKRKRVPPNMAAQVLLTFGSDCWLDMRDARTGARRPWTT